MLDNANLHKPNFNFQLRVLNFSFIFLSRPKVDVAMGNLSMSSLPWTSRYRRRDSILGPVEWVDTLFDTLLKGKVLSVIELKLPHGKSCIINNPSNTMANLYLGNHLDTSARQVEDALQSDADSRSKPLIVTVRGTGGGKTRLFEELRLRENLKQGTVALSITFNNKMEYEAAGEIFINDPDFVELNMVLSVLLRVTATAYAVSLSELRMYARKEIGYLNLSLTQDYLDIEAFGRHFLQRIICDIDLSCQRDELGVHLSNFPVFIDEIMTIHDNFQEMKVPFVDLRFKTAVSILSKMFLNERFHRADTEAKVNTCLSISSLDASATGKTGSRRQIRILLVPERLDAYEIVRQWWTVDVESLNRVDLFRLMLVAETVNTQPRIVSFVSDFIKTRTRPILLPFPSEEAVPFVDGVFIMDLYKHVFGSLVEWYLLNTFDASPSKLMSLVFGDCVQLDEESATMIRRSIFTNSLESTQPRATFHPVGSLLMLAAAFDRKSQIGATETVDLLDPYYCFYMLLERTIAVIEGARVKEGDTLEVLMEWWLKCRIAAAVGTGAKSIILKRLLPGIDGSPEGDLEVPLPQVKTYSFRPEWPILTSGNLTKFAMSFNSTKRLRANNPFVMYESKTNQGFDHLISFLLPGPTQSPEKKKAFLVFLDEKSSAVRAHDESSQNAAAIHSPSPKVLDCKQFERIKALASELRALRDENKIILSLESQALVDGDFKFIYVTTYADVTLESEDSRVHVSNEADTKSFFGFMWPFLRASHSPSSE